MSRPLADIAWLAGLLEGEGCFKRNRISLNVSVVMTDCDVICRAALVLGGKAQVTAWGSRTGRKTPYYTGVSGNAAAGWMMTVYPFLGERRQAKIRELLQLWRDAKPRYGENVICGHLDQPHLARGMCSLCYDRQRTRRQSRKESSL